MGSLHTETQTIEHQLGWTLISSYNMALRASKPMSINLLLSATNGFVDLEEIQLTLTYECKDTWFQEGLELVECPYCCGAVINEDEIELVIPNACPCPECKHDTEDTCAEYIYDQIEADELNEGERCSLGHSVCVPILTN